MNLSNSFEHDPEYLLWEDRERGCCHVLMENKPWSQMSNNKFISFVLQKRKSFRLKKSDFCKLKMEEKIEKEKQNEKSRTNWQKVVL